MIIWFQTIFFAQDFFLIFWPVVKGATKKPKPKAIDEYEKLAKMVHDAELVVADNIADAIDTSEIDLDNTFSKNVDEVLDFFGNGHSRHQKVAPNNFFELKDDEGEKDEILLDQCNLDPSTGTLLDKNGNFFWKFFFIIYWTKNLTLNILFQETQSLPKEFNNNAKYTILWLY